MVTKKKKSAVKKSPKKSVKSIVKKSSPRKTKQVLHSKTKGKKGKSIDAEKLVEEMNKSEDEFEEEEGHRKKKHSSDEIRWEDLEGFDFEDYAYTEVDDGSGAGAPPEEVFDEEP